MKALHGWRALLLPPFAACVLLLGIHVPAAAQAAGERMAGTWQMRSEAPGLAGELRIEPDGSYRIGMITGRLAPATPGFTPPQPLDFRALSVFGRAYLVAVTGPGQLSVFSPEGERVASGTAPSGAAAANPLGVEWAGGGRNAGSPPLAAGGSPSPTSPDRPSAPAAPGQGLGVEWRTGNGTTPPAPPPSAGSGGGLGVEWAGSGGAPPAPPAPGNGLGVEWRTAGGTAPPAPTPPPDRPSTPPAPGQGLGVEWRTGNGTNPPASPPPSGTGGGLGVEWRTGSGTTAPKPPTGPPAGGTTPPSPEPPTPTPPAPQDPGPPLPGDPVPPPPPVDPPPVETPPVDAPPGGTQPPAPGGEEMVCTTPEPPEMPDVPDPKEQNLRGLLPNQVGDFRSGFWIGYLAAWTSLRTGQPVPQSPVHGQGQTTDGAYNRGWVEGMGQAGFDFRLWKSKHPPVCRPRGAPEDPAAPLVGVWAYEAVFFPRTGTSMTGRDVSGSLALDASGTFSQELRIGQTYPTLVPNSKKNEVATYRVEGDRMTMSYIWGQESKTDVYEIALNGNLLTLRGPQATYTLRRVSW